MSETTVTGYRDAFEQAFHRMRRDLDCEASESAAPEDERWARTLADFCDHMSELAELAEATERRWPDPGALLEALPGLVKRECVRRRISQRQASADLGLTPSTITRVIQGRQMEAVALLKLLRWLDLSAEWLSEPEDAVAAYRRGWLDCIGRIQAAVDGQEP